MKKMSKKILIILAIVFSFGLISTTKVVAESPQNVEQLFNGSGTVLKSWVSIRNSANEKISPGNGYGDMNFEDGESFTRNESSTYASFNKIEISVSKGAKNIKIYATGESAGMTLKCSEYVFTLNKRDVKPAKVFDMDIDDVDSEKTYEVVSSATKKVYLYKILVTYDIVEDSGSTNPDTPAEPTTYTVTVDDTINSSYSENVETGKEFMLPTAPSKDGYTFTGWLVDGEIKRAGETITITKNLTITAQWAEIEKPAVAGNGKILDVSLLTTGTYSGNTIIDGTIYTLVTTINDLTIEANEKEVDGYTFKNRLKTGGTSSSNNRLVKIDIPNEGIVKVYAMSGGSSVRPLILCKDSFDINKGIGKDCDTTLSSKQYNIDGAGTYYLGSGNSGINIYYIEFIPTKNLEATAEIKLQYDTENSTEATKIRFIGVLSNIDDVTKVDTAKFSISVNGDSKVYSCTQLYKTVSSCSLTGGVNIYYVVFTFEGIEDAIAKETVIDSIDLTITFTDGKADVHALQRTITLGKLEGGK